MDSVGHLKTQTIKGKYQIKKDIFASCYLDVIEADDKTFHTFIGTKHRSDTMVPVGTKLYLNAEAINRIKARRTNTFDEFCTVVQEVAVQDGKPVHICTPLLKESHPERRQQPRKPTEFFLQLNGKAAFIAANGSPEGLRLIYKSRRAILSIRLHQICDFTVTYKAQEYTYPAEVVYIQYDWKTHEHVIGIRFTESDDHRETVMNLLIDPHYTIDLSGKQTIDTQAGKVSRG